MRLHVLGLPYTQTQKSDEWINCPFTQKTWRFCKMMKEIGHEVFHHGSNGSNPDCTENFELFDHDTRFGFDLKTVDFYNQKQIESIRKIIGEKDIILLNHYNQKPVADAFNNNISIEFNIGYLTGSPFIKHKIFDSYAIMHYTYGAYSSWGTGDDVVIPTYFDPEDFYIDTKQKDYILYLGRIRNEKGLRWAESLSDRSGVRLVVAGTLGDYQLSAKTEYVGKAGFKERAKLMSEAKALIYPSQYIEPFGGAAVEAMMCGTPVISTKWGAFVETVEDGVNGFKCSNIEEMIIAIQKVSSLNPEKIRSSAIEKYSMNSAKSELTQYFERINK